ncbi:MAG: hypothetical protein HY849_07855 [Nitrosomonadales bacterium]|nr:hypothetical protein [Nitrosomonadales bacterium]
MAISSVSSGYTHIPAAAANRAEEARVNERENDGDKDDQSTKVQAQSSAKPPEPTINTSGQVIGGIISVQA